MVILFLLILAQQPTMQERIYHYSLLSAATAHIADIATTGYCLGEGTCVEKNPLLAPFSDKPLALGITKGALASGLFLLVDRLVYRKGHPKIAIACNFIVTGIVGSIAVRNSRLINGR